MSKNAKIAIGVLVLAAVSGAIYYFGFYKPAADKKAADEAAAKTA